MRYALIYHCEVCEVTNVNDEMFEQKKKVVQQKSSALDEDMALYSAVCVLNMLRKCSSESDKWLRRSM